MSRFDLLTTTLVGGLLFSGVAHADAPKATVEASVTINGKTIVLPHARAFSTGLPYVLIYFAEKPLDGFKYGTGGNDSTWSDGKYGTVLRFAPALNREDEGKPVLRYVIPEAKANEDDRVELRSAGVDNWKEQRLSQMAIKIEQLESSDGVVRGKLSWKGDPPISAWSVEFSLPLEEGVL
ncbi:MAG: hypothetical protein ABI650_05260 [Dokdonella sp.]